MRSLDGMGNRILRNHITENEALGIDLGGDGVTLNHPGDADESPNNVQNHPAITFIEIEGGDTHVSGRLNSRPGQTYRLEFFAVAEPVSLVAYAARDRLYVPEGERDTALAVIRN